MGINPRKIAWGHGFVDWTWWFFVKRIGFLGINRARIPWVLEFAVSIFEETQESCGKNGWNWNKKTWMKHNYIWNEHELKIVNISFFWHILSNLMFLFSQIQIGWIGDSDRDAPTVGSSKNIQRYQPQKVDVGWLIGINSGLMCD